jgi:predicted transcriptional regulator
MKARGKPETADHFVEERRRQILDLALRRGRVAVPDLVRQFGVTPVTVRKDLRFLDEAGQLVRTHGGAVPRESAGYEPTSAQKTIVNRDRKRRIAEAALSLIAPGDRHLEFDDGGLASTVEWYRANRPWWEPIKSGEYRRYYEEQYAGRLGG